MILVLVIEISKQGSGQIKNKKTDRGEVFISEQNKCMLHAYFHVTTTFEYNIEPDRTYLVLNLTPCFMIISYYKRKKNKKKIKGKST
jgi:hypothetical protein